MNSPVQRLLVFHSTSSFDDGRSLAANEREARTIYGSLTPVEQAELAEAAIDLDDDDGREQILCCLACFQPGSLTAFHGRLVERRIFYPGLIFHGATNEITARLMTFLREDEHGRLALGPLVWIGDETVQSAFAEWREQVPSWAKAKLDVDYTHEAGWELREDGTRRDLFSRTAFPLIPRGGTESSDHTVRTGIETEVNCPWCHRRLTALFDFENIGTFIPGHDSGRVRVMACTLCANFGTVFAKGMDGDRTVWHDANNRPEYLPADPSDYELFPNEPLVLSGKTRHFLEGAHWSMIPDVAFSQVGGLPTWIQNIEYPKCPDCFNTMPFVGQISNEDFDEDTEGIFYAFHCPECAVAATSYQQT